MASINPFLPIQEGTGTPSPENVRPIKPAVSIAGGKNLLKIDSSLKRGSQSFLDLELTETGVIVGDSSVNGGFLVQVKPNVTYTFSFDSEYYGGSLHVRVWKEDIKTSTVTLIVNLTNRKAATFTTDSETECIRCGFYIYGVGLNQTIFNMQLEEGSTATAYEPYRPLDIYGGYLDIANSRIVEEWDYADLFSLTWNTATSNRARSSSLANGIEIPATTGTIPKTVCEKYTPVQASASLNTYKTSMCVSWEGVLIFYYDGENLPSGGMAYKLATAVAHSLSPTQLAQAMEQLGIKLSSTLIDARRRILLNTPHIVTASGSIASFNTDMKAPLKECKIHFLPVQSGSGDPSPDNIRPITGWTGLNICLTGNNIWDEVLVEGPLGSSGTVIIGSSTRRTTSFIPVKGGSTYRFCGPNKAAYGRIAYCDKDKNPIYVDITNGIPIGPFTARDGACYMQVTLGSSYGTVYGNDISFNYPSSDTVYHAHEGNEIQQVSFGENGTIYGGYVDLLKGELIEEWKEVDLGSLNWSKMNNYNVYSAKIADMVSAMITQTVMAENYKFFSATSSIVTMPDKSIKNHDSNNSVYVMDTDYTTSSDVSAFKTAMAGMKMVYKLATPITYQLTPQQLKSLKGINNIWSDTNDAIEVKYWTH